VVNRKLPIHKKCRVWWPDHINAKKGNFVGTAYSPTLSGKIVHRETKISAVNRNKKRTGVQEMEKTRRHGSGGRNKEKKKTGENNEKGQLTHNPRAGFIEKNKRGPRKDEKQVQ